MGNIMSKKTYDIGQYFPFWGSLNEAEKNLITDNSQVNLQTLSIVDKNKLKKYC